jgi:hypothetical protein
VVVVSPVSEEKGRFGMELRNQPRVMGHELPVTTRRIGYSGVEAVRSAITLGEWEAAMMFVDDLSRDLRDMVRIGRSAELRVLEAVR